MSLGGVCGEGEVRTGPAAASRPPPSRPSAPPRGMSRAVHPAAPGAAPPHGPHGGLPAARHVLVLPFKRQYEKIKIMPEVSIGLPGVSP